MFAVTQKKATEPEASYKHRYSILIKQKQSYKIGAIKYNLTTMQLGCSIGTAAIKRHLKHLCIRVLETPEAIPS